MEEKVNIVIIITLRLIFYIIRRYNKLEVVTLETTNYFNLVWKGYPDFNKIKQWREGNFTLLNEGTLLT